MDCYPDYLKRYEAKFGKVEMGLLDGHFVRLLDAEKYYQHIFMIERGQEKVAALEEQEAEEWEDDILHELEVERSGIESRIKWNLMDLLL